MAERIKVVILEKKVPKKVVNIFGNVHSIIGTYDKGKIRQLKKMIDEKSIEFGLKYLEPIDEFNYSIMYAVDEYFDRAISSVSSFVNSKVVKSNNLDIMEENDVKSNDDFSGIKIDFDNVRKINFEDLEPLGQIIDDEDDVYELKELKRELLSSIYDEENSKQDVGVRKK